MSDWANLVRQVVPDPTNAARIDPAVIARQARGGKYQRFRDDPEGFAREVLRLAIWDGNAEMLQAAISDDRIAIRAGRKVGKSNTLVVIALWWLLARRGRVLMTSTTYAQIHGILWRELTDMNERAHLGLNVPLDPATGVKVGLADITGRTASTREAMQGYSGADSLYLIDEASGVADEIIEAVEGNCAGGGTIIMAGNPTRTSGRYHDVFKRPGRWRLIHLNSERTPNALEGRQVIPGLATREWIADMAEHWGVASPLYQVHVLGNFPSQAENSVIGLGLVQTARDRHDAGSLDMSGSLALGVDVARFGDDATVIQATRGPVALPAFELRSLDGVEVAQHVVMQAERLRRMDERVRVSVDIIGVGASVFDQLSHHGPAWLDARAVNVSERATSEGYSRLRDQLWFALRDWLRDDAALPPDARLEGDLTAPIYGFDTLGRAKVESKDELKKRLGRSPDRADSLALAVYQPAPEPIGGIFINGQRA